MSSNYSNAYIASILESAADHADAAARGRRPGDRTDSIHEALLAIDQVRPMITGLRGGIMGHGNEATGKILALLQVADRAGYAAEDAGMCATTARVQAATAACALADARAALLTLA